MAKRGQFRLVYFQKIDTYYIYCWIPGDLFFSFFFGDHPKKPKGRANKSKERAKRRVQKWIHKLRFIGDDQQTNKKQQKKGQVFWPIQGTPF